jgi:hypothetical protein
MKYYFFVYFVVLNVHYKIVQFFVLLDRFDHLDFHQVYVKQMYFYQMKDIQSYYIFISTYLLNSLIKTKNFRSGIDITLRIRL